MRKKFATIFMFLLLLVVSVAGFAGCTPEANAKVDEVKWDAAMSLLWKNVTFEYTHLDEGVSKTQKVELLADGGMHQSGEGWGEKYVIFRDSQWEVYNSNGQKSFEYDSADEYIQGNYGDDYGFMKNILPKLAGNMDQFTFDEAKNQYVAENYYFIFYGTEGYNVNITAKFENDNIVYLKFDVGVEEGNFEVRFYDYGTTNINYPASILEA